jgi:acyl-CoA hydrolase
MAPQFHSDVESVVETIVRAVGPAIVLGLPLGLGKANTIANALYERVARDRSLNLKIFTALSLEAPRARSELERRLLGPILERTVGGYPPLAYVKALRSGTLPSNIEVNEFFLQAGGWLAVPRVQQSYISANYTHAARYMIERGMNVIAQLIAKREGPNGPRFSLSCNTDTTLDLLEARRQGRARFLLVGQVNAELPFMPLEGECAPEEFAHVLDSATCEFPLFGPPKEPIGIREHAIGLHVARLISDGGTLQIGIGQEADGAVHGLIVRQNHNAKYQEAVSRLTTNAAPLAFEERQVFRQGLYGLSEMFVDGFLELMRAGILKREVDGALLHAAFFLGPHSFYRALREMPEHELARLRMTAVSFTNELYGNEDEKRRGRVKARFVNSAMIATLLGSIVSDGLEDGRVVSGVGGQYNFVAQAFALADARSILLLKAARASGRRETSNIRWRYGHETIPRHLRDIVVTEYGIADLRGKSDEDVIAAMLSIADSRFQPELMREAKDAGKLPRSFEIARQHRENRIDRISEALKPLLDAGLLPAFPFGTDLDETEQNLAAALEPLKNASTVELLRLAAVGIFRGSGREQSALTRMGVGSPAGLKERFYRALLRGALTNSPT